IRDFHVTGVQTCALPICGGRSRPDEDVGGLRIQRPGHMRQRPHLDGFVLLAYDEVNKMSRLGSQQVGRQECSHGSASSVLAQVRSEERRVGKGWKWRWVV